MIVDTSAIVAIVRAEPDAKRYGDAIEAAESCRLSAATFVEAAVVLNGSRDPVTNGRFDRLLKVGRFVIEPVSLEQARIARAAYRDFGKGSGHPARLNFGDCFAYALARATGEPLLYKGDDFSHTDIEKA